MTSSKKINDLRKKTISSTIQLISREILMKCIAIGGQLFLIRLLEPAAFGIFAILSFLLATAETFSDIGLNLTIIQKKQKPTISQLSTIFFIKFFLTISIVVLLNLFSSFLPLLYNHFTNFEVGMFQILSLTLLLRPLQSIIVSLLERELRYKEIAVIDLTGMISYYLIAIVLAIMGFGIWSFIWGVFAKTIIETAVTYLYYPWLPKFTWNLGDIKQYIALGKYFQLGLLVGIVQNGIIPVVGGTKLPLSHVGFLDWSFNMASFPRIFIDNLGRVIFASFSRIQENKQIIATSMEKSFEMLNLVGSLLIILTLLFGHDAVHYLLTDKWLPALPSLYFYVASIFFMNGNGLFGHALFAVGKAKDLVIAVWILTILEIIIAYFLLVKVGFVGIAISFFLTAILTFFVNIWLCYKEKIYVKVEKIIMKSGLVFLVTLGLGYGINLLIEITFITFFVKVLLTCGCYLLLLKLVSPDLLRTSLQFLKSPKK